MAQERFIKFRDSITSAQTNEKYAGILPPAIYTGFDAITSRNGLTITLGHDITGEVYTNQDLSQTRPRGIWTTKQGVVIKEDTAVALPNIAPNLLNVSRYDLVVGVHTHDIASVGGISATYEIVQGTGLSIPVVPNPQTKTVLGTLIVPAKANDASGVVWQRAKVPQLGGKFPALLAEVNRFTAQNQENQVSLGITNKNFELTNRKVISNLDAGNSFNISSGTELDLIENKPNGTLISITNDTTAIIKLRGFSNQVSGTGSTSVIAGLKAGYAPMSLSKDVPAIILDLKSKETVTFRKVSVTGNNTTAPFGEFWSLVGITSSQGDVIDLKARVTALETGLTNTNTALNAHANNQSNPHNVTKAQVGLGNLPNSKTDGTNINDSDILATAKAVRDALVSASNALSTHTNKTDNPHNVTKTQVGLGALPNAKTDDPDSDNPNQLATGRATKILADRIGLINSVPQGVILMWSGLFQTVPAGWAVCDGNNGTPDLRGRFVINAAASSQGIGNDDNDSALIPYYPGSKGGTRLHYLTADENGKHSHAFNYATYNIWATRGTGDSNNQNWYGSKVQGSATETSGLGRGHNNMPPFYALLYIMKL